VGLSAEIREEGEIVVDPKQLYKVAVQQAGLTAGEQPLDHMNELGLRIRKGQLKAGKFPRSTIHRVAIFMTKWMETSGRPDYTFTISSHLSAKEGRRIALNLVALDPTAVTMPILRRVHSSVAVSGTMSPIEAFSEMLGFGREAIGIMFGNPFSSQNRIGIVVQGIDTTYENRDEDLYRRIVDYCAAVVEATPGNIGVFAPSYPMLRALLNAGFAGRVGKKLFVEKQELRGSENDRMIEEFKAMGEKGGAVLLGVQGGRNSEGGDFPGAMMESVVVVGVPYARPNPRTERLIEYFDGRFNGKGRDYAYVLPAMTRAVQAAGRPVRRMSDRGAIVLLDQRFGTGYLKRFMPSWLREVLQEAPNDPEEVGRRVKRFFSPVHSEDS
jgi:DNA excision repair protein ERCC-2